MADIKVICPYCGSDKVNFSGYSQSGKHRCKCKNEECSHNTFQIEYSYKACEPGMSEKIVKMTMNASGTRDIARILGIDKDTVTRHLRKLENFVEKTSFLKNMNKGSQVDIVVVNALNDSDSDEEKKSIE